MPEWDDGQTWPRRPRSPADAIRPPKGGKHKSCRAEALALAMVALTLGVSVLVTATVMLAYVASAMGLEGHASAAAYIGLAMLLVWSRIRWLTGGRRDGAPHAG